MNDESIFFEALQKPRGHEREKFLREACGDDVEHFQRVNQLLVSADADDSLLELPDTKAAHELATSDLPKSTRIGNYKLIEKLGEGGMGTVYLAQQIRPVKRTVALKVIRAGLERKQVIARFEVERQSLALMDHPNIARVLDAGETDDGDPFFVMELVRGVPITEYCNDNRLSTNQRLKMMIDVCIAVQHAHQKGVIHRDLKPSNILVAQYDDRPVPKVIDFGVAKATHQELTEKTLHTAFGQIVGTLEYMSPEQAVLNQLDVDTRADVYSLGVILYELLVGETPLNGKELRRQGLENILRTIREHEPPRPSLRLSSQGKAATQTAAYHRAEQSELAKTLRGDLDWIVMRALEKDRDRRYASPIHFSEDIQRYLKHDPIPRSSNFFYRARKLYARNRMLVVSIAAVILSLASGLTMAIVENRNANRTLDEMCMVLEDNLLDSSLSANEETWNKTLKQAYDSGVNETSIRFAMGLRRFFQGEHQKALQYFEAVAENDRDHIGAQAMLAATHAYSADTDAFLSRIPIVLNDDIVSDENYRDKMFQSYLRMIVDSETAVADLESILEERPSWLFGQVMLAEARGYLAMDSGNGELARETLRDLEFIQRMLPESSYAAAISAFHHHVAYRLSRSESTEIVERLESDAMFAANRLLQWQEMLFVRCWLLQGIGKDEFALEECAQEVAKDSLSVEILKTYSQLLMKHRRRDPMLDGKLSEAAKTSFDLLTAKMFADCVWSFDRDKTEYDASYIFESDAATVQSKVDAIALLLVIGNRAMAEKYAHTLLDSSESIQFAHGAKDALRFLVATPLSEQTEAPMPRRDLSYYLFFQAMERISMGDEAQARELLTRCIDTDAFLFGRLFMAEALLPHVAKLCENNQDQ